MHEPWILYVPLDFSYKRKLNPLLKPLFVRISVTRGHSFFFFFNLFILLFLAALGLCCCTQAFSSCGERGLLFVEVHGLLIVVASLVAEHRL